MAKTPKKRSLNANKKPPSSNKKRLDKSRAGKKSGKIRVKAKNSRGVKLTLDPLPIDPPPPVDPCNACDPCAGLPTGTGGIPYTDAAGARRCLPMPASGDRFLKWDTTGPYWALA